MVVDRVRSVVRRVGGRLRSAPGRREVVVTVESATGDRHTGGVDAGLLLLRASRRIGVPLENLCANRALCMTCAVRVLDDGSGLSPADRRERRYLDWVGAPGDVRLACQATVTGTVSVRANLIPVDRWEYDPAVPWWDDLRHGPDDAAR